MNKCQSTMKEALDTTKMITGNADYLLAFAMTKLSDRELAKDLVQDTFVSAIQNLDGFKGESALRTWLTSILNRKIIDHWRKAETRFTDPISHFFKGEAENSHWIDSKQPQGKIPDFELQMDCSERHAALQDCIDKLPMKWSGILTSKYLKEEKTEFISKNFDVTPSNIWVILHRAKLVLRDCLEQKITK